METLKSSDRTVHLSDLPQKTQGNGSPPPFCADESSNLFKCSSITHQTVYIEMRFFFFFLPYFCSGAAKKYFSCCRTLIRHRPGALSQRALASLLLDSSWTSFLPPCICNETSHHFTLKPLFPVIKSASAEERQILCKPAVEGRYFVSFIVSFQAAEIHYLPLKGQW